MGKKLFLPIITAVCVPFPGETLRGNVRLCRELIDPFDNKVSLTIDGQKRNDLIEGRAQSRSFAWFPEDNLLDAPRG